MSYIPLSLRPYLAYELLGNPLARWGLALLVLFATLVAVRLARAVVIKRLRELSKKTETVIDDLVIEPIHRTSSLFVAVLAFYVASLALVMGEGFALALQRIFFVALLLQLGAWSNHVLNFSLERYLRRTSAEVVRPAVARQLGFFGRVAIWSIVLLLALDNVGIDVTALIAGLGVGGVAVALAVQNVLGDTVASLAIILDKPFEPGDFIIVGDLMGTVEKIGIKTTRLKSIGGEQLVFGNHDLLASRIRNYKRMEERRVVFTFGVAYETPVDKVAAIPGIVERIVDSTEQTRFDRAHFKELGDFALSFEVVYFMLVPDYALYMDVQQTINLGLLRELGAEGIELAYPTQTVFVKGAGKPETVAARTSPRSRTTG